MEELTKEQINDFKTALDELSAIANTDDSNGVNQIAALLAMDDAEFEVMAPLVASSFQKQLNTTSDKLTLTTALQMQGIKHEDLIEAIKALDELSAEKIEISEAKKKFLIQILIYCANAYGDAEGTAKRIVQIATEKTSKDINFPVYATLGAAGADVYAAETVTIDPGETKIVPTGLKMEIPYGYAVLVQMRSGLAAKTKLRLANSLGLIDSDYRGEIGVILENIEPHIKDLVITDEGVATGILYGKSYTIEKGERIAQLRLVEAPKMSFIEVKKVDDTERGDGGYGSTGIK